MTHFLTQMSTCISGNEIVGGLAQILSITARPVPPSAHPIQDQILITVIANGTTSQHIFQELAGQLDILATKFDCTFTNLRRFGEHTMTPTHINTNHLL